MKAKNNRLVPTDSLWKPDIHDLAPVVRPQFKKKRLNGKQRRKLRNLRNRRAKHVRAIASVAPMSPIKTVTMACRCLEALLPRKDDIDGQILVLEEYIELRGRRVKSNYYAEGFYKSRKWRILRYKIIQKHGGRCMACKATNKPSANLCNFCEIHSQP